MASLSRDSSGRVIIQFVHPVNQKRRTIRAGKMTERDGQALKLKVEALAAAVGSGLSLDAETQAWVVRIGAELRDKLAAVGLCEPSRTAVLGPFLDAYIAGRTAPSAGRSSISAPAGTALCPTSASNGTFARSPRPTQTGSGSGCWSKNTLRPR